MKTRFLFAVAISALCFQGCGRHDQDQDQERSETAQAVVYAELPEKIASALRAEIPIARAGLEVNPLARFVDEDFLTREIILHVASATFSLTERDKLFGSQAIMEGGVLVSVSAMPLQGNDWNRSILAFPEAAFERISQHYERQIREFERQHSTSAQGVVHLYLGRHEDGGISAAIGLCEVDHAECSPPRQFATSTQGQRSDATITLEQLSPKRCDIDTEGELVIPGQGYLLSSAEVARSEQYWSYLDPQTRAVMRPAIKMDTSDWLVSEKHIGKFDIDKAIARKRAVDMWNSELERTKASQR